MNESRGILVVLFAFEVIYKNPATGCKPSADPLSALCVYSGPYTIRGGSRNDLILIQPKTTERWLFHGPYTIRGGTTNDLILIQPK